MKKTLSIIISLIIALSAAAGVNVTAFAATDYPDDPMYANEISLDGTKYVGEFTQSNRTDYFKINLNDDGLLTVTFFTYTDTYFEIDDENMQSVRLQNLIGNSDSPKGDAFTANLSEGEYYINVHPYSNFCGKYWVKADFTPFNTNETEPNNTQTQAQKIDVDRTVTAAITEQDEVDFFKFSIPVATKITYTVSSEGTKDVFLYGEYDTRYIDNGYGANFSRTVTLSAGNYIFKVNKGYYGKYYIKWHFEVDAPTDLKAIPSTNKIKFSWVKAQGASGYTVERYYSGKWNEVGSTTSNSYSVASLSAATEYQFRVKSYLTVGGKKYYSSVVYLKAATKPSAIKLNSANAEKKRKITVKWAKTTCSGYQIQYSTSKSFKGAKTLFKGAKATSATVSNLKAKKKYYFRVRAYKTVNGERLYGAWSNVKSAKAKK
jgi:hypothetical protein